ncbi:hypothetical protein CMQ_7341 [Grosmannia clavigera kw1407]|uniref:Pre-rRNA-processing protein RIX1 n=1 Tax=Grosmannia clavigera (strain kw1407 / UAMH 11150) TaxID=655863 RepID=F0XQ28_GROCL|nr:uncharacterized protein CMQ_7341 [Grosmannia clavigera kw1407]EFX00339.1 hypothetical protein CMQ_7341 [Grosmannia clavigera kw1407]
MSVPADLRVLCRKLVATTPGDLPALCPILVNHILRCGSPLSASAEQHNKSSSSEASVLVHKLKTQVNALLHGKNAHGRFAGMVLAKAIIDVGGWECLRTSENWVRGLLSILQRPDPFASKELCVVVLARIYTLLQEFPTLVREIATPTVPSFATACLQLLRPAAPGKPPKAPASVIEAVTRALAALIPHYPTTLRPFSVQIRNAVRAYVAPTASDSMVVPPSLRQSSRRLLVLLHYTAPKNNHADEWSKLLNGLIQDVHVTADQVFRAVRESTDPGSEYMPGEVSYEGLPEGGSDLSDDFPSWTGLQSGAERLAGLLDSITEVFRCPTKASVAVPLGRISSLVSRMSLVLPPAPGSNERDHSSLINPSIGRDERDELWSALPEIHVAAVGLLQSVARRMGAHAVPLAPEMLEDAVRMFSSDHHVPLMRQVTFSLVQSLLPSVGPSMSRATVGSLGVVVHACCQDILEASGFAQRQEKKDVAPVKNAVNIPKNKLATANADLFLNPSQATTSSTAAASTSELEAAHLRAAQDLLSSLLAHLPQQHVRKADRALLDRTAILSANKEAMLSSVLHPYVDRSGRYFANTIPFLARAFPNDLDLEVLRSNLRTAPHYFGDIFAMAAPGTVKDEEDGDSDEEVDDERGLLSGLDAAIMNGEEDVLMGNGEDGPMPAPLDGAGGFGLQTAFAERSKPADEAAVQPATAVFEPLTLKRKIEQDENLASTPKRPDTKQTTLDAVNDGSDAGDDDQDNDSDGSVQLDMVFDGEDDEESGNE